MATASSYEAAFHGSLKGLLQWPQFERLWQHLRDNPEGWYVRNLTSRQAPGSPMEREAFLAFLDEAEKFLRSRHHEDFCGFIYLDDMEHPTFIKVFDPRRMGSACGCGGAVSPRWTISRMPPPADETTRAETAAAGARGALSRLLERIRGG